MIAHSLLQRLEILLGPENLITGAEADPYLKERRGLFHGVTPAVVKPASTEDVAAVVRLARDTGTAIVPQGGNTGLVGGAVPDESGTAIVLNLSRMNRIRALDPDGNTMVIEAGATLAEARQAAASVNRFYPLTLAPEKFCTIGGTLSTNAGGLNVLAYGSARDFVLGLEVVLADGRIWNGLRTLRKDNTGYDLKHLFTGAEGTLGIITAAALKLFSRPRATATALFGVDTPEQALALFRRARSEAGPEVTAAEFLPLFGMKLAAAKLDRPLPRGAVCPWYVLIELNSVMDHDVGAVMRRIARGALESGEAVRAAIASGEKERARLWAYREIMSDAQGLAGTSIKHDVSVPVADVPAFIHEATEAALRTVPGCRPCPFGHLGDGNVHFNISQPEGADGAAFIGRWYEMNAAIHAVVTRFNGSIAAEHGVGRLKASLLPGVKSEVELDLMRALKRTLDPHGILNPGVVLANPH